MKKLLLATFGLILTGALAFAGGIWNGFPIIGNPSNTVCLSFGNNGVCNTYVPGTYLNNVPATAMFMSDTGLTGTNGLDVIPQSVYVPAGLTGATSVDAAPLTTNSITIVAGTSKLMLNPAGTIAALTVLLPADSTTLLDAQTFNIYTTQTVTALTVTPFSGTTLVPTITTVTAAAPVKLIYNKASKKWLLG
jgi:hypothetical protein